MANIIKRNNGNGGTATMPVVSFGGLVDNVLQNTLSRFFNDDFWGFDGMLTNSQVPVNVKETDKSYEMEVVAPGLRKEDFSVKVNGDVLTVTFEHKQEDSHDRNGYLRHEYRLQSFNRSFTLDDSVDADKISAEYRNGILYLRLPKKEGAQRITKDIQVK